jgi:acyl dehydratase
MTEPLFTIARSWQLTPRLISAFAAGVDDPNPAYLDDLREGGLIGHPGLVFTFQWNTRHMPGLQIDPEIAARGVHAWTDVRWTRPFREGDVITAQGEQIATKQIAPGTLTVQRIRMRDAAGAEVAVMDNGGIIRGVPPRGPDLEREPIQQIPAPPDASGGPAWEAVIPIAPHAAHAYTECADIWNPIHTERRLARAAGLPDIILHGSATITIALREVINRSLGGDPARLRRLAGQFRGMVIPGESITVRALAEQPTAGGTAIFFDCLNARGEPAIHRGLVEAV